jgi:phospholipid-binding lipoprotein MlaA
MHMVLTDIKAVMKRHHVKLRILIIISLACTISGCATSGNSAPSMEVASFTDNSAEAADNNDFDLLEDDFAEQTVEIADPLEPLNRTMYHVNDTLYFLVVKPVSLAYMGVIPEPVRIGIHNFFNNISTPVRFVNCLLQGKGEGAGTEFHRFTINTTIGILGFGDPALDQYGLEPVREDLGQTLAVYGLGDGFYIVWPLLGPSTVRDSVGKIGDWFLYPVSYVEPEEAAIGISAVRYTNESSFYLGEYEAFKSMTIEPYVGMREAYIQYRRKQIQE